MYEKNREELGSWRIVAIGAAILLVLLGVAAVIAATHLH